MYVNLYYSFASGSYSIIFIKTGSPMKKVLFFLIALCASCVLSGQQKVAVPRAIQQKICFGQRNVNENSNPLMCVPNEYTTAVSFPEEEIGNTIFDLQSNSTTPFGRLVNFEDGTFSAVWTRGTDPTAYNDRGTGYNYFDGISWQPEPTTRLESVRTGWPSLARLGAEGEIVISHRGNPGLELLTRSTKGEGAWNETTIAPPAGATGLLWARMVTGGENKNTVHMLVVTTPTTSSGVIYEGLNGALLYYRSTDGGVTWDKNGVIIPGLTANDYYGFGGDCYAWAEPEGNNLAFVVTDPQNDLILMKSADNGETWTKRIIWEEPYPHLANGIVTDTLWASDGAASLAYDKTGKLHLAFAVYRMMFTASGYTFWPGLSGIVYWNEDCDDWTGAGLEGQKLALHIDSLDLQGKQLGYYNLDWNLNNQLDIIDGGGYNNAWASWPQMAFDDNNNAILIYSALMENYDNTLQNYRHILYRASSDNATTWSAIYDATSDDIHQFDECVWPVMSDVSDNYNWYFIYHLDAEPGTALGQDGDTPGDNFINFFEMSKIVNNSSDCREMQAEVGNIYPNPVHDNPTVNVTVNKSTPVSIQIISLTGQTARCIDYGVLNPGTHRLTIDASKLSAGAYFLMVRCGQQTMNRKMIVK